ncbi:fatty acid desaturase [Sphingobacterium multivorum]
MRFSPPQNFATGSKVLTWLLGGLNFQVEHHLFPRSAMCIILRSIGL